MRYALISDIHANLEAVQAVLAALKNEAADVLLCLGDVVGYGANPEECVALVKDSGALLVAGNHDQAAVGKIPLAEFNPFAAEAARWTAGQLAEPSRTWLGGLPMVTSVGEVSIVHGTFDDPEAYNYLVSVRAVVKCLRGQPTRVGFVGHSHVPLVFVPGEEGTLNLIREEEAVLDGGQALVNVGSVGQPRDEDPRAAYTIYDEVSNTVWMRRVEYDIDRAARKIIEAGLPRLLAERLWVGR